MDYDEVETHEHPVLSINEESIKKESIQTYVKEELPSQNEQESNKTSVKEELHVQNKQPTSSVSGLLFENSCILLGFL